MAINTWGEALNSWDGSLDGVGNSIPLLSITSSATTVNAGQSFTLTANVTDADIDDTHTYLWSSGETTQSITITAPTLANASTITRTCVANDGTVDSNTASFTVNVNAEAIVVVPGVTIGTSTGSDVFWQHSDNFYTHTPSISDYSGAEYIIADRRGNVIVFLTLNNGIIEDNGSLIAHVDDSVITFRGAYYHQMVLIDATGNRLPPEFQNKLKVKRVFLNEAN